MNGRKWTTMLVVPALAGLMMVVGCNKGDSGKSGSDTKTNDKKGSDHKTSESPAPAGAPVALKAQGVGSLKGKVVYDGTPPARDSLKAEIEKQGDKSYCLMGPADEQLDPTWIVDKSSKGVKNVVVFVRPPAGKYFDLNDAQKKSTKTVTIDQPHCAFEPHVVVFYPSYFDGKAQKETGEKFEVHNSATITHNTKWEGNNRSVNGGGNDKINPKQGDKIGKMPIEAKPASSKKSGWDLVSINCDIHKWMGAKAIVTDNPFYATTGADGSFEIKDIPAGSKVEVYVWHESMGSKPKKEEVTIKSGENTLPEVKIKK